MYLVRLVYASSIGESFNPDDIEQILESARKNNKRENVTGLLCFNRKYFLQCLEGSRAKVNRIYHSILNDNRHKDIIILDYKEIVGREFDRWSMGYVPESSLTEPVNLKYSGGNQFKPYEMSGDSANQMMLAFRDVLANQ